MAVRTKKGIRRQVLHRFFHEIFILTLYFHNASHTSWLPFVSCPYILIIDFVRYFQGLTISYDGVCLRVLCVISHFYSLVCDWTAENECAAVELLSGAFIIPGLLYRCLIIQRLCLWLNLVCSFFFSVFIIIITCRFSSGQNQIFISLLTVPLHAERIPSKFTQIVPWITHQPL